MRKDPDGTRRARLSQTGQTRETCKSEKSRPGAHARQGTPVRLSSIAHHPARWPEVKGVDQVVRVGRQANPKPAGRGSDATGEHIGRAELAGEKFSGA